MNRPRCLFTRNNLLLFVTLLLACCVVVTQSAQKAKKKPKKQEPIVLTRELVHLCKGERPISGKAQENRLKWLVAASGEASVLLGSSPQHQAACWTLYKDKTGGKKRGNRKMFLQRYALATLHFATTKSNTTAWDWPMAVDEPWAISKQGHWMTQKHECNWYGVKCHRRSKQVYELDLGYLKLDGLVPREISLLTGLKDLDFHANDFQGVVPHKLFHNLRNLEYLRLHMNGFFGAIQPEIVNMKKLKELHLFGNYFGGSIPTDLAMLSNSLQVMDLYANQFEGRIPTQLGKLAKLQSLDFHDNNLTGSMPSEICKLRQLKELIADCLGPFPEVTCDCCTICCRGLPDFKCVDVKTGNEIVFGKQ